MTWIRKNWDLIVVPTVTVLAFIVFGAMGLNTPLFEFFGIIAILMGSLLTKRESRLGPILMLIGNGLLLFYFITIHLSGQMIFTTFFIIINAIMIYFWIRPNKKNTHPLRPSSIHTVMWLPVGVIVILATLFGANGGTAGALDYLVMSAGIIGNTMLIRKKIDGWFICMICDGAGVVLFALTGSWLLMLKSTFSIYNEIDAIIKWRRLIKP